MAQHRRDIKAAKSGSNVARFEHSEVFDDNLLPDAGEIEKLSRIDEGILTWLKQRAEKEQDFRHQAFTDRLNLVDNHNKREHSTSRIALIIYMFLVSGCIAASYFLVRDDHNLQGTIFGGVAVILALAVLITRRPPKEPENSK